MLEWMAWSPPVAVFFICVVLMLACMTYLEIRFPTVAVSYTHLTLPTIYSV